MSDLVMFRIKPGKGWWLMDTIASGMYADFMPTYDYLISALNDRWRYGQRAGVEYIRDESARVTVDGVAMNTRFEMKELPSRDAGMNSAYAARVRRY